MNNKSRIIRVFQSSTFRDFAEERDLLVKKVFPMLRRLCHKRQVELVEVDLRWGITEEEAQQGKVLPISLAEIDRAHPYFMGFIGECYGRVPEESKCPGLVVEREPGSRSTGEARVLPISRCSTACSTTRKWLAVPTFYFRDRDYSLPGRRL